MPDQSLYNIAHKNNILNNEINSLITYAHINNLHIFNFT